MNTFTVVFFCIQACLVQSVFSQSILSPASRLRSPLGCGAGLRKPCPMGYPDTGKYAVCPLGYGPGSSYPGYGSGVPACPLGYGAGIPAAPLGAAAPYGGIGEGNIVVRGQMPVTGKTAIQGSVPIMGAVGFLGDVASAGAVSIAGRCNCGCGSYY